VKFDRSGIIVISRNYVECVSFYKNIFELKEIFTKKEGDFRLTCFEFGESYLMIETDSDESDDAKSLSKTSVILRLHVADIDSALASLQNKNISTVFNKNDWGSTIDVTDPDGNRINIRDEQSFVDQI
jgi:lactoylglutathione lyase